MNKTGKLTAKETSAVTYYCEPTSETRNNWVQSCLAAGYSRCIGHEHNALRVLAKDYIKTAIGTIKGQIQEKINVSREFCIDKLLSVVIATDSSHRDKISAISVIGDFAGYKRETAPNQEREIARRDIIERELVALEKLCVSRTAALSTVKQVTSKQVT